MKTISPDSSFSKRSFYVLFSVVIVLSFLFYASSSIKGSADMETVGGIGWVSFNCSDVENLNMGSCEDFGNYKVVMTQEGYLNGHAWANPEDEESGTGTFGWIQFGGLSNFPSASGTLSQNAQVLFNQGGSTMRPVVGWARVLSGVEASDGWDGWVSLSGDEHGVTFNENTGQFSGFAWGGPTVGWVSFNPPFGGVQCEIEPPEGFVECPFDESQYDHVFYFDQEFCQGDGGSMHAWNLMRADSMAGQWQNCFEFPETWRGTRHTDPSGGDISEIGPGVYEVFLMSYDTNHDNDQDYEEWGLRIYDSGGATINTDTTRLPHCNQGADCSQEGLRTFSEQVGDLVIDSSFNPEKFRGWHKYSGPMGDPPPSQQGSAHSVESACVAFNKVSDEGFTVEAEPNEIVVTKDGFKKVDITVTATGSIGEVGLSASGVPSGIAVSSPNPSVCNFDGSSSVCTSSLYIIGQTVGENYTFDVVGSSDSLGSKSDTVSVDVVECDCEEFDYELDAGDWTINSSQPGTKSHPVWRELVSGNPQAIKLTEFEIIQGSLPVWVTDIYIPQVGVSVPGVNTCTPEQGSDCSTDLLAVVIDGGGSNKPSNFAERVKDFFTKVGGSLQVRAQESVLVRVTADSVDDPGNEREVEFSINFTSGQPGGCSVSPNPAFIHQPVTWSTTDGLSGVWTFTPDPHGHSGNNTNSETFSYPTPGTKQAQIGGEQCDETLTVLDELWEHF